MTKLVEFKKELKERQAKDRIILKQLLKEVEDARKNVTRTTLLSPEQFKNMFPMLHKEMVCYPKFREYISMNAKYIPINFVEFLDEVVKRNQSIYNLNQAIINAMDNDKIINYIDLERLLSHLIISELPFETTFKILGMAAGFDKKYLEKHDITSVNNAIFVFDLGAYFDINGNSILNEDIFWFACIYHMLTSEFLLSYYKLDKEGVLVSDNYQTISTKANSLLNAYINLINENNKRIKETMLCKEDEEIEDLAVVVEDISKKPLSIAMGKLRRYYRNETLVEITENLEEFNALLDECQLEDNERKYILHLLEEKLAELNENKILKYLNSSDKDLYEQALVLLNGMHYSNSDYYPLVQLMEDLRTAGDMLEENTSVEDKEYIFAQISDSLQELKLILEKYFGKEVNESENNLVFLCDGNDVPYLKQDSDELDGNFYKAICNGIKKIRKDNQRNFKLVMTSDNMPYRLYDILSSKIHISFIEIDNGIYLLVGADTVNQGYDEMVRRVMGNVPIIKSLESSLKTQSTRNKILSSHEEYLSLFNPEAPNVARVRK